MKFEAYDGYASSNSRFIATHPLGLDARPDPADPNRSSVQEETIRFSSPTPGVTFSRDTETATPANPGQLEIVITWEQVFFHDDGSEERCTASTSRLLTVQPAKLVRMSVQGGVDEYGNFIRTHRGYTGALTHLLVGVIASGESDFTPLTVRFRSRTGAARLPTGVFREAQLPLGGSSERIALLGRYPPLRVYRELFVFANRDDGRNEIARLRIGPFSLFSTGTGYYHGNGGFEVQVFQKGQRLLRVRATLRKCHKKHGCFTEGRVESLDPLITS